MNYITEAERLLAKKYGPDAWVTVRNWSKVRGRLEGRIYARKSGVKLWASVIGASVAASLLVQITAALLRLNP